MTPEERADAIIDRYEQTCLGFISSTPEGERYGDPNHVRGVTVGGLRRKIEDAIRAAVEAEREACARVAEEFERPHPMFDSRGMRPSERVEIAAAIRSRP
jgi:hypothetical protein